MDPFTNQPYAFDDQGSAGDPREVEFNNGIREITVRKMNCIIRISVKNGFDKKIEKTKSHTFQNKRICYLDYLSP